MLEIIVLLFILLILAGIFWPENGFKSFFATLIQQPAGDQSASHGTANSLKIPEDSMLRRHFLTHLKSEIEASIGPRPTEFSLKRHYDTLVAYELENRLEALAG